jgi:hypothetical protein
MNSIYHIPLKSKGFSGAIGCHLLWQQNNIYIMDNHRMALWAWMQQLKHDPDQKINLLHIDAHYDTGPIESVGAIQANIDLQDYLNLQNSNKEPLIQWDNYLTAFFKLYSDRISNSVAFTQKIGLPHAFDHEFELYELLKQSDKFFDHSDPWIVNIDLDYFYARQFKNSPMVHEKYIQDFFQIIKNANDENKILALSVALSPECCGSWDNAQLLLEIFSDVFKLELKL